MIYLSRKESGLGSGGLFATKLAGYFSDKQISYTYREDDPWTVGLVFVNCKDQLYKKSKPIVQRLDGIYFNTDDNSITSNNSIIKTYRKSSGIIFQSELASTIIRRTFGNPTVPYRVIHNGTIIDTQTDPAQYVAQQSPKLFEFLSKFEKVLLCVGKWRQAKRLSSILDGAAAYCKNHSNTCLVVVGPLDAKETLLCDERLKEKQVFYAGPLDNQLVRQLQKLAHCSLNLSFTDSCPSAVVEALAHGTPCVVTRHQGVVDLMIDRHGVILDVDEWDYGPISFNRHIKQISSNLVSRAIQQCLEIGRFPIRHELSITITAQKYVDFLNEIRGVV